jgi:hypothetical protein
MEAVRLGIDGNALYRFNLRKQLTELRRRGDQTLWQ